MSTTIEDDVVKKIVMFRRRLSQLEGAKINERNVGQALEMLFNKASKELGTELGEKVMDSIGFWETLECEQVKEALGEREYKLF